MKSTTIRRGELLFINLFYLGPKGCKLMKINSSFRIRGRRRNIFLHPLVYKYFNRTIINFLQSYKVY